MASTGFKSAGLLESWYGDGSLYSNLQNARLVDLTYATVNLAANGEAEGLYYTNFDAGVPADAKSIDGVSFILLGKSTVGNTSYGDAFLIQGGTGISEERLSTNKFLTSDSALIFGSSTELWGATLTPAIVNDPTFGVSVYIATGTAATVSVNGGN